MLIQNLKFLVTNLTSITIFYEYLFYYTRIINSLISLGGFMCIRDLCLQTVATIDEKYTSMSPVYSQGR